MKIVTIKIGSSSLLNQRNTLDEIRVAHIANQIVRLRELDIQVVLVVSGAVACGAQVVELRNEQVATRHAAAGVGQAYLISKFQNIFARKKLLMAQILLTGDVLDSKAKSQRLGEVVRYYVSLGVVPVINENDVIELNSFGGNDLLAARIAQLVKADQLLILSRMAKSAFGVGGGETKMQALAMMETLDIKARIVNGKTRNIIWQSIV